MFCSFIKSSGTVLLFLLLIGQSSAFAQTPVKNSDPFWADRATTARIAVLDVDIKTDALDAIVGESVSAVITSELAVISRNRYTVISRNEIKSMVGQQMLAQSLGCVDEECMTNLGEMAKADLVISSSIGKVDEEWVFTLELMETTSGTVLRRQAATYLGSPDGLIELCRPYVA